MAAVVRGDIVVIPFPFSDLTATKRRPALVLSSLTGPDVILCQITSRNRRDKYSIPLSALHFESGGLPVESYVRPNRLFTADKKLILRKAGALKKGKMNEITAAITELLRS